MTRPKLKIRPGTREIANWPFLYSVVEGRGLVKNIQPRPPRIKVTVQPKKRRRVYVLGHLPPARW